MYDWALLLGSGMAAEPPGTRPVGDWVRGERHRQPQSPWPDRVTKCWALRPILSPVLWWSGYRIFSQPELVAIVLDALRFLQQEQRLTLHSYVVMENHLHLVASAADLSKEMGNFKSFTARSMIDYLQQHRPQSYWLKRLAAAKLSHKTGQRYQVWQEGFHPQLIISEAMLLQTVDYIHQNPVRRGDGDDPAPLAIFKLSQLSGGAGAAGGDATGLTPPPRAEAPPRHALLRLCL
jgi:putative transposase